jgi:glutamine synthetase
MKLNLMMGLEVECIVFPLGNSPWLSDRREAFMSWVQGLAAPLLTPVWDALRALGVGLDGYENELSAGQIEFNLDPEPPLAAADALILVKLAAQEMLHAAGYGVTFMAKFDNEPETTTSGLHVHQSAFNQQGENIFYDPAATCGLSQLLLHYMGGQLTHAKQLAALTTPTITGYKRYRPGTWAPTSVTWSLDNRTSLLRVMAERGPATRVENRLPDSAANPYLTLAGMIAAGVAGIRNELHPGSPIMGNVMTDEAGVPKNMWEAAQCLATPSAVTDRLGPALVTAYRGMLLQTLARFEAHVTDWEIAEYRGII